MATKTLTTFICDNCGHEEVQPAASDTPPEMPQEWVILWSWNIPRKLVCGPKCGIAYMLEALEANIPVMQLPGAKIVETEVGPVHHTPVTHQHSNAPAEEQGLGGH